MGKDSLLLTVQQAVAAICLDFRIYAPQIPLLVEVLRLIEGHPAAARTQRGREGAWVRYPGRRSPRWLEGPELVTLLCDRLKSFPWRPETLAAVCVRVFRTRAQADRDPHNGRPGIRIETGMETFACRQCGRCCLRLDYHREVRAEDVTRWRTLGRSDILAWVGTSPGGRGGLRYRIWVRPGTNRVEPVCPFLLKDPAANRWRCRIHDVKPEICRQYPLTRKHAEMTGCRGFEDQSPPAANTS